MKNCSIATVGSKRYWSLNKIIRSRNIFFLLSLTHPYVKWRHQDDEDPMRIQNMNDSYLFWHTSQMLPIFDKLSSNSVISSDWLAGWLAGWEVQFSLIFKFSLWHAMNAANYHFYASECSRLPNRACLPFITLWNKIITWITNYSFASDKCAA